MMFCQFKPRPDTPGRFLCGVCNIPSSRNKSYGPEGPPPRHCPKPPDLRRLEKPGANDQVDWYNQPLIVIVGIHRTLSSCLAECLESLGVFMGSPASGGEDLKLATLLESLMPFPSTEKRESFERRVELIRARLVEIYRAAKGRPVGVKYPHLCRMLPELRAAWPNLRVIHAARRLEESIESLVTRASVPDPKNWARADRDECQTLQEHLFQAKERWLAGSPHLTVVADDLIRHPAETIDRVAGYLEPIGLETTEDERQGAASRVEPALAVHSTDRPPAWLDDTTIIVKAYERPDCLHDLIASIHRFYPAAKIIVGDDSLDPADRADVEVHRLPHDVGLAAGRNYLVNQAKTPYVLLCDDDFLFTEKTDVQQLYEAIEETGFDVIAGASTCWRKRAPFLGHFAQEADTLFLRPGPAVECGMMPCYHIVENFFLARTEALRRVPWDNRLKVGEHIDWCLRARQVGLFIGCLPAVELIDASPKLSATIYERHRNRARRYRDMALNEWAKRLGFRHFRQELPGFLADVAIPINGG